MKKLRQNNLPQSEQQSLTELYDEAVTDLNKATDIIGQIR